MPNDAEREPSDCDGASGAERLSAPADEVRQPRLPFPVVGIGASAGGLEAYSEFLRACPVDAGMAYVLVQHLSPDRESLLAEILATHTRMPVEQVEDGAPVEPNRVYVTRPGHTLTIRDGCLHLGTELAARGHGRPVDDFFRSLAEEQQQRAVAVVFSGMGSNGTAGAQAVKAVGGLVVAQEPESAHYPAMPRSLIDAHLSDFILRPAEVPEALARYAAGGDAPASPRDEQTLADVLAVLRTRTRHDFTGYRKPTLLRRVRRRMGLGQFATIAEYVRALRQTPAEVTALADDLLIHVTGFFRDPEAWATLRDKVIVPLAAERPDGPEIRCWVAACATGEEAYTLAILLLEAAEAAGKRFGVKIFATDLAERALGAARTGLLPNGIESEVAPERLPRFFERDDSFYRVKKEIRELVVFAPQNLLQDPPFSRLDIVTCRNLLIYLEPETQRRVLALVHFALREGGTLMLGSSESAAPAEGDFEPINKKYRLFRRVGPTRSGTFDLPAITAAIREGRPVPLAVGAPPPAPSAAQLVGRALLDLHTPPAVAVDATGQIVHVHGDTSRFLTLPTGGPTLDLLALSNEQVRGAVRAALHRATDTQLSITVRDGLIDTPEGRRRVEVRAAPLGPPRRRATVPRHVPRLPGAAPGPAGGPRPGGRRATRRRTRAHPKRTARRAGRDAVQQRGAEGEPRGSDQPQRGATEHQRGTRDFEGGGAVAQRGTGDGQRATHGQDGRVGNYRQRPREPADEHRHRGPVLGPEVPHPPVHPGGQRPARPDPVGRRTAVLRPAAEVRRPGPAARRTRGAEQTDPGRAHRRERERPTLPAARAPVPDPRRPHRRRGGRVRGRDRTAAGGRRGPRAGGLAPRPARGAGARPQRGTTGGRARAAGADRDRGARRGDARRVLPRQRRRTDAAPRGRHAGRVRRGGRRVRRRPGVLGLRPRDGDRTTGPDRGRGGGTAVAAVARDGGAVRLPRLLELPHSHRGGEVRRHARRLLARAARGGVPRPRPRVAPHAHRVHHHLPARGIRSPAARRTGAPESEERLQLAVATGELGTWDWDVRTGPVVWNDAHFALQGYAINEVVPSYEAWLAVIHPEDRAGATEALEAARDQRTPFRYDYRSVRNGTMRWLSARGHFFYDESEAPVRMIGVLRDVTDLKENEAALLRAKDTLEARVAERTVELERALDSLATEMERRRGLSRQLATVQEDERMRVARDLHDTVGQLVTGLALSFKAIETGDLPAPTATILAEAQQVLSELGREVHGLATRLRPTSLDDIGLEAALGQLVGEWSSRNGVNVDFHSAGLKGGRLPTEVETALYRVVQEALTNVAKHARATSVNVVVARQDGLVSLVIEDNGTGFDTAAPTAGRLGVLGMRERVELVGGEIDLESAPGSGTTVVIQIPITMNGGAP